MPVSGYKLAHGREGSSLSRQTVFAFSYLAEAWDISLMFYKWHAISIRVMLFGFFAAICSCVVLHGSLFCLIAHLATPLDVCLPTRASGRTINSCFNYESYALHGHYTRGARKLNAHVEYTKRICHHPTPARLLEMSLLSFLWPCSIKEDVH